MSQNISITPPSYLTKGIAPAWAAVMEYYQEKQPALGSTEPVEKETAIYELADKIQDWCNLVITLAQRGFNEAAHYEVEKRLNGISPDADFPNGHETLVRQLIGTQNALNNPRKERFDPSNAVCFGAEFPGRPRPASAPTLRSLG